MAFKSIATLAGDVLRNVETKRAGANPAKIETPDQTSREATVDRAPAQDEPAHLLDSVRGLTPTSKGMRKTAAPFGDEAQRQVEGGNNVEQRGNPLCNKVQKQDFLRLIMSNRCLDTAKPAAKARSPRAAVSRHLVLIGGTDHARSFSRTG